MPAFFCLTIRFIQPYSHGRGVDGEPEWPPSPLRAFQALVAASAARWNERLRLDYAAPALQWLEQSPAPTIVAADGVPAGAKYRLYVPDNVADKVAKSWRGGKVTASIADYRTEKEVRPTHLRGDTVHYLFPLPDSDCPHKEVLSAAARSITHLGWGVDMVVGTAAVISGEEAAKLPGERWRPADDSDAGGLRVPCGGTLAALSDKHEAFLNRLTGDAFKPVPPLSAFRVVGYRRATDVAQRPWVAFTILKPDTSGYAAFCTTRRCRDVAAWVRNAAGEVCRDWTDVATFVHGHDAADTGKQLKGARADERFMFLPLPTINAKLRRVESIRRVLIAAPPGFQDRVEWVRRRLSGQDLFAPNESVPKGVLNVFPKSNWVLRQYTEPSTVWSTVTPVIWPGHDDRDSQKAEAILRKAFVQSGLSLELVEQIHELDWRPVGYRAGVDLASRYVRPDKLNGRLSHVRVRFPHPIPGPLVVGAGRYRGFGLFAAEH